MIQLLKTSVVMLALLSTFPTHVVAENSSIHKHRHLPAHFNKVQRGLDKVSIEKAAKLEIFRLVLDKKIHKSWKSVPVARIGKTHYGDTDDWVVGFDNMKIKNKKRRTLYIFVSIHGDIRGVNYTGN